MRRQTSGCEPLSLNVIKALAKSVMRVSTEITGICPTTALSLAGEEIISLTFTWPIPDAISSPDNSPSAKQGQSLRGS